MIIEKKKYGFLDMVLIPFKVSPMYSIIFAIKYIADALMPTLSIFATASFINNAIMVYNGETSLSSVYLSIALIVGIMIYSTLINSLMSFVDCKRNIYFRRRLVPEMLEKLARLEYRHIENPETAQLIRRVCPNINFVYGGGMINSYEHQFFQNNVWEMYTNVLGVLEFIIYFLGITITIFTQVWWIAIIIVLVSVPVIYFGNRAGGKNYGIYMEKSKVTRQANYLSEVMMSREGTEERNIFGYVEQLNTEYGKKLKVSAVLWLKAFARNTIEARLCGMVVILCFTGTMLALVQSVTNATITIGMFIALMGTMFGLSNKLSWDVNDLASKITEKRKFLKDLTKFTELEEQEDATSKPKKNMTFNKIEFKDVSFKYPGTDKLILDGVSFVIENGKHYSFVGVNGAGKTTITKLIIGLYTNYEGEILVDGKSIRDLTQAEIKGLSAVVYQDFAKYNMSLYDNLAIADIDNSNTYEQAEKAIELVGLSDAVTNLENGMDTLLGKIGKDGVDISGGEWQRVAMARIVMSNAPLKILDEPTAALDPISESAVYHNFEQISKGKTTIFISHRLGSTKLADIIYVLANGKIVESGCHSALMAENGLYCDMFNSQVEWYRSDVDEKEVTGDAQKV
ncbi:MAG: ABC transporter ATP-binding protein [Clostridia bacterium]|jgi:ABC transporter related protein